LCTPYFSSLQHALKLCSILASTEISEFI
jgi:hypothetical protein